MLKGHAKIELTDVTTGETHVQEDDNMFTQAIYESFNNTWTQLIGGTKALNDWHLPLTDNMLGGIALFADTIPEDEKQTYFPEGNEVLGYAGTIASDGSSKFWGSRNLLESVDYDPETKTVKYVWDFGTTQGNGTIKCIGMMNGNQADYYGQSAWNKKIDRYINGTSFFSVFGNSIVEWDDDIITWMEFETGNVIIQKAKINLDNISLNNTLGDIEVIEKHKVQMPLSNYAYSVITSYWKDGDDGYWYCFTCFKNSSFSTAVQDITNWIQVIRINKNTYAMEYHNITLQDSWVFGKFANPIITKKYIIVLFRSANNAYDRQYMRRDKVLTISKTDWTVTIKILQDKSGKNIIMLGGIDDPYMLTGITATFADSVKLPNGLYQLNDLLINDDAIVIEQTKPPINEATFLPAEVGSATCRTSFALNPVSGNRPYFIIINKKKSVMMIKEYSQKFNSKGEYVNVIRPFDCQKLITINNLSEPVTKTATQTMKITYTITEAD